jgi:hypothetical protein
VISDVLQERVREAWAAGIPRQYAQTGKDKGLCSDRLSSAAIIQPPPPAALVEKFLLSIFGPRHLTQKQIAARTARANIGRPGRKRDAPSLPVERPSPAKKKPTEPWMSFGELDESTKPFHDLDLLTR